MSDVDPRPAEAGPGPWQMASVVAIRPETPTAKTFVLRLSQSRPHLAGQHYIVRLTAPDGYRAQRSYSVSSPPGGDLIELTVERLPEGEVSDFLHDGVTVGDLLEVRGPIGYFRWDATTPAIGVAGGSGIVPLMAMLRAARQKQRPDLLQLVVSVAKPDQLYYAAELAGPGVTIAYTRVAPASYGRPVGRLSATDLNTVDPGRSAFVCGSPAFCDAATSLLRQAGIADHRIQVERFGPSG